MANDSTKHPRQIDGLTLGSTTKNPTPAPGQIWSGKHYACDVVVDRVDGDSVYWRTGGWDRVATLSDHYTCIGVETSAGRVMVGERRNCAGANTVLAVADCGVVVRHDATGRVDCFSAQGVARWPTVRADDKPNPHRAPAEWDRVSVGDVDVCNALSWAWMPGTASEEAIGEVRAVMDKWRNDGAAILPMGVSFAPVPPLTQEQADALADRLGLKMADPRAEREQRRREIDAVLREDARRFPAFATARLRVLMAMLEDSDVTADDVAAVPACLAGLRAYEAARGPDASPWRRARDVWEDHFGPIDEGDEEMITLYERARGLP